MPTLPPIAELAPNLSGAAFYLCAGKERRPRRGGEDLLAVQLLDSSGQLPGRVLEAVDDLDPQFEAGEFVRVEGRTQLYHGRLQLVIDRIRRVMESDRAQGFREDACLPSAPRPVDEMWRDLLAIVEGVRNPFVKALLEDVLAAHEDRLKLWPAAVAVHHAYRGGLLEHVLQVATVARTLAASYGADVDVVIAGAVLHDLGKLRELAVDPATSYTRDGNLLGHITIGAVLIHDACAAIPDFPETLRAHIQHLVVSHHGERALGSPAVPMTVEAFILSAADALDATIHQVRSATAADKGEGEFTGYHPRLERVLWKRP